MEMRRHEWTNVSRPCDSHSGEVSMAQKNTPIHPGEILLEDFLKPLEVSQNKLSLAIGVEPRRVSEIVNGDRSVTVDTAMRLGRYLKTGPEFWLNLQQEYDLRIAKKTMTKTLKRIEPVQETVS